MSNSIKSVNGLKQTVSSEVSIFAPSPCYSIPNHTKSVSMCQSGPADSMGGKRTKTDCQFRICKFWPFSPYQTIPSLSQCHIQVLPAVWVQKLLFFGHFYQPYHTKPYRTCLNVLVRTCRQRGGGMYLNRSLVQKQAFLTIFTILYHTKPVLMCKSGSADCVGKN